MGDHLYIGGMGKEWTNQQGVREPLTLTLSR